MDLIDKFYAKIIWADKITKKIQNQKRNLPFSQTTNTEPHILDTEIGFQIPTNIRHIN